MHENTTHQKLKGLTITAPTPHMMPVVANNPSSAVFSIILIIAYENIRKKKKLKIDVPKINRTHQDRKTTVSFDTIT